MRTLESAMSRAMEGGLTQLPSLRFQSGSSRISGLCVGVRGMEVLGEDGGAVILQNQPDLLDIRHHFGVLHPLPFGPYRTRPLAKILDSCAMYIYMVRYVCRVEERVWIHVSTADGWMISWVDAVCSVTDAQREERSTLRSPNEWASMFKYL